MKQIDRIRKKNVEELAETLVRTTLTFAETPYECPAESGEIGCGFYNKRCQMKCISGVSAWLESEVEE